MSEPSHAARPIVTVYRAAVGAGPDRPPPLVRRGFLQTALASALGRGGPDRLSYVHGGRPVLDGGLGGDDVSAASTAAMVVVAVARGCGVGVDVERIDPGSVSLALLEESLTASERAWVRNGRDPARFFHLWCRKEAVLKGLGFGLSLHPRQVAVDAAPEPDGWSPVETPTGAWWVRSWAEGEAMLALAVDRCGVDVASRVLAVPSARSQANDGP